MTPAEESRAEKLLALARERYSAELRPVEEQVLRDSCRYEDPEEWKAEAEGGSGGGGTAPAHALTTPAAPEERLFGPWVGPGGRPLGGWAGPVVRTDFLRWLLTDSDAFSLMDAKGLRVYRARITEELDLQQCSPKLSLEFRYCLFEALLRVDLAELKGLYVFDSTLRYGVRAVGTSFQGPILLIASEFASLDFSNAAIDGWLDLRESRVTSEGEAVNLWRVSIGGEALLNGFVCAGAISMPGAEIGGQLDLSGGTLESTGIALNLDGARVGGFVSLNQDFASAGEIRMVGAEIKGWLDLGTARLTAAGSALNLDGATIRGHVFLSSGFTCAGEIRMVGAEIKGQLDLTGASLNATDTSLNLDGATVHGDVFMSGGFTCAGEIRMVKGEIGGQLNLGGAELKSAGVALTMDNTTIRGDAFLNQGLECAGEIRAVKAEIGGQLNLSGANLKFTGDALTLDGVVIHADALLFDGFKCAGQIRMPRAEVGGVLDLSSAHLSAKGDALNLNGATIRRSASLREDFTCDGNILLTGTRIYGQLSCRTSKINFVNAEGMETERLFWLELGRADTTLNLRLAKIQNVILDETSMGAASVVFLNHMEVKAVTNRHGYLLSTRQSLDWLGRQPQEHQTEPQPWMELARMREAAGDKAGARRLIFELRVRQMRALWSGTGWGDRVLRWLGRMFARLEENPFRIVEPLAVLLVLGTLVFHGYRAHFAETGEAAYKASHTPCVTAAGGAGSCAEGAAYPRFSSFVYTLENVLPVVKLGEDGAWAPREERAVTTGRAWDPYWLLVSLRWFLILSGWAMGIVLAAAIGARFRS